MRARPGRALRSHPSSGRGSPEQRTPGSP
jgi:hypothetical protein